MVSTQIQLLFLFFNSLLIKIKYVSKGKFQNSLTQSATVASLFLLWDLYVLSKLSVCVVVNSSSSKGGKDAFQTKTRPKNK